MNIKPLADRVLVLPAQAEEKVGGIMSTAFTGFVLLNEANAILVKKGYVTSRINVNTDNIQQGEITFEVITGRIDKVKLNDNSFADKLKIFFNKPKTKGNVLNIRDIDTMTDNFNKNASNNFAVNIEPSDKEGFSNL